MRRDYESAVRQGRETLVENRRLRAEAKRLHAAAKQAGEHLLWLVQEVKRQRDNSFYRQMQAGIQKLHRCHSRHVASFAVRKVSEGKTVWEGVVEEFTLADSPAATTCYAWY